MPQTLVENRRETRTALSWPVSIWVPKANRFFNGHSSNISKTGVFLKVPMTTPIGPGSIVELNFPRTTALAEQKGQFARIKKGKVVRIDRENTLDDAAIGVGVVFDHE
ncbi:PilZ domain-containing protein [Planctomycetota bacterium]